MRSNPRTVAAVVVIAAAVLLVACGDDDAGEVQAEVTGLSVEVDPESVAPGETLAATVVNESDREFSYGAGYELERKKGDRFVPVDLGERAVIQIAYVAEPGGRGPAVAVKVPRGRQARHLAGDHRPRHSRGRRSLRRVRGHRWLSESRSHTSGPVRVSRWS